MALEVDCSSCGGRFRVPDSAAGKKIRCPKCKGAIDVAASTAPVSEPAIAPAPSPAIAPLPAPKQAPAAAAPAVSSPAAVPTSAAKKTAPAGPAVLKMPSPAARAETIPARSAPAAGKNTLAPTAASAPQSPAPALVAAPANEPAAEAPESWWFQAEDGEVYGPVERAELEEWRAEGRISPRCQLRSSRKDEWIAPAELFPELAAPTVESAAAAEPAEDEPQPTRSSNQKATRKTAPQPADDAGGEPLSTRSKAIAFVLAFFLPWTGAHRFYLGYPGLGVAWALTFGGLLVGAWVDAFRILFGALPDAEGRRLRE